MRRRMIRDKWLRVVEAAGREGVKKRRLLDAKAREIEAYYWNQHQMVVRVLILLISTSFAV